MKLTFAFPLMFLALVATSAYAQVDHGRQQRDAAAYQNNKAAAERNTPTRGGGIDRTRLRDSPAGKFVGFVTGRKKRDARKEEERQANLMAVYLADVDEGTYGEDDPYRLLDNGDITEHGQVIDSAGMDRAAKREWVARKNKDASRARFLREYGPQ